jgi:hypothetical protein
VAGRQHRPQLLGQRRGLVLGERESQVARRHGVRRDHAARLPHQEGVAGVEHGLAGDAGAEALRAGGDAELVELAELLPTEIERHPPSLPRRRCRRQRVVGHSLGMMAA